MRLPDEKSQTSEAQLRNALDAMPHKVWMVRPEGPALYYNRAMRAFAGEALSLPDRASRERALVHADDLPRVRAAANKAIADPKDFELELRLRVSTSPCCGAPGASRPGSSPQPTSTSCARP